MKFLTLVALLVVCASNNGVLGFELHWPNPKVADVMSGLKQSFLSSVQHSVDASQRTFAQQRQDWNAPLLMEAELLQTTLTPQQCLGMAADAAATYPCAAGLALILSGFGTFDTLTAAQSGVAQGCAACTEPSAEFGTLASGPVCNITNPVDLQAWGILETSITTMCTEATQACAADAIYGFVTAADNAATLCANQACSTAVLSPVIVPPFGPMADATCVTGTVDLFCLEDSTSDLYCINYLAPEATFTEACATPCFYNFSSGYQELVDSNCYTGGDSSQDTFEESILSNSCAAETSRPLAILDYCTVNAAEQNCLDAANALATQFAMNNPLDTCPFSELMVAVPAPEGPETPEPIEEPMCGEACAAGVAGLVAQLGCCTNIALDLLCGLNTPFGDLDLIRPFVADDVNGCDVVIPAHCDRPTVFPGDVVATPMPTEDDDTIGVAAALKAVNVFALLFAVVVAFIQ